MSSYQSRLQKFEELLADDNIEIKKLRELCFNGIPDQKGLRATCWKLLLHYLPGERSKWEDILFKKREQYHNFIKEMILEPVHKGNDSDSPKVEDHPLNPSPDSQWRSFFDDNLILDQIDKDVRRLYPDMDFFQRPTAYPCINVVQKDVERLHQRVINETLSSAMVTTKGLGIQKIVTKPKSVDNDNYLPLPTGSEAHWEVVERILFLYAKLNPGQSYVQGMNEIIGPLYYTFASDPNPQFQKYAEADTFYCFMSLMAEIRDIFIRTLDNSSSGIGFLMKRLMNNLEKYDDELYQLLINQHVKPEYFSFRWITLLLCQEFDLPDVIQVWDALLSCPDHFSCLIQVCTAMLVLQRESLLSSDFASNVKLLQKYPPCDIRHILVKAAQLPESNSSAFHS